ncbi:hypothetical protein, conserved, partial [Eimeria tenella]
MAAPTPTTAAATAIVATPAAAVGPYAGAVAVLARTLAWCGVWLWATTFLKRPGEEKGLLFWSFSELPKCYSFVEAAFAWMVSWDFCGGLLAAAKPLSFLLSFHSLVDLATLPLSSYFFRFFARDPAAHNYPWLLGLGWLRFLRLLRTETVLACCFPTLSRVSLRVVSIGVSWLMIVLTFAGGIFILEAPRPAANYNSVFDFCFYAVVSVMTVGYGDFAPETPAGRGLAICVIVSAFVYLPGEIQRLLEALREPRSSYGGAPGAEEDYLCVLGPIAPQQLAAFCFQVGRAFPGSSAALLVLSPLPLSSYLAACQGARPKGREDYMQYERGSSYTIYRMEFAACVRGAPFAELARALFVNYEVYLIGLVSMSNRVALNPAQYTVGAELLHARAPAAAAADAGNPAAAAAAAADQQTYAGIVLAPNLEVVARLASAKEIGTRRRHKRQFGMHSQQS